jgi:pimeloyl-ACP methyl ester carboxylesterase
MIRCGYVDLPEGQVHYRHCGTTVAGTPPIIFLHQTASSSRMWHQVMQRLDTGRRLIAFDTPGFGGSFDPPGTPGMPQYGRWMLDSLNALGIDMFDIVGHHTGVCIAAEMIRAAPERVGRVAMIGPLPLTPEEREAFRGQFSAPMAPDPDGAYLKQTWDYIAHLGAASSLDLIHREVLDTLRAWHGRYQAYSAVWDQDFTALLQAITCPLLLMCAPGDILMQFFDRACTLRPDAKTVRLSGDNFEPDQDAEGTAAALQAFLSLTA